MNLTRERIRQVEGKALAKLKEALRRHDGAPQDYYVDEGPVGKRRLPVLTRTDDEDEEETSAEDVDDDDFDDDDDDDAEGRGRGRAGGRGRRDARARDLRSLAGGSH